MKSDNVKKNVFSGMIWKFSERILAYGVSFAVSVVLARLLLPEHYGLVSIITVFIDIANVFVVSGFSVALVQKKDADETDFSTIFYCSLVVSIVIYVILFFAAPFIASFYRDPFISTVLRVFALRLIIASYSSIQHAYVERHMLFRKFFFSTLVGTIFSGVVGIIMAYLGFGVWALVAQYITNTVVDICILNITVPWHPQRKFSWHSACKLMGYGWKVLAADLSGTFFDKLRSLIIGRVYTMSDLAFYNKAQQYPSLLTNSISASVMTVLFPVISNENDNIDNVKRMTRRAVKVMAYIIYPLLFGLSAVSEPLVILLLTEKWSKCIPYIQLLCISSAISIIGTTSLQTIKAIGRSDILLSLEFYKKPIYLLLLIIGVKKSVLAVAITMVIYSFYAVIVNARQLKKLIGYSYKEEIMDLLPALALALFMAVVVWSITLLPLPNIIILFLQIASGIVIYVGISHLFSIDSYIYLLSLIREKIHK